MAKKEAFWAGDSFSMKPVDPATTSNPVTRVLNMVMGSDGEIKKRRGIDRTFDGGNTPDNHITAELNGEPHLITKNGTRITAINSSGVPLILSHPTEDPPISDGSAIAQLNERGSFAIHAGEVYYADSKTIFSWDGNSAGTTRRPGIVSLQGREYNETADNGGFVRGKENCTSSDDRPGCFQYYYSGAPVGGFTDCGAVATIQDLTCDAPTILDPCLELYKGEKSLNTGFCFAFYDPKRRIYGKRSEVFACPYAFGSGQRPTEAAPILLSPHTIQHAKKVYTPDFTLTNYFKGHDTEYKIAIWMTRGFRPVANATLFTSGGWWVQGIFAPAMSQQMNTLLFLEGNDFNPATQVLLTKDDSSLFASGRYIDTYARPLPCKHMMILPNGTAVYLFPTVPDEVPLGDIENDDVTISGITGNYAIYSVGHPEQIGLHTQTQRDTISKLSNLRGDVVSVISDGINNLALTRQAVYRVGFDGGVILSEIAGGRGIRAARPHTTGNSLATGTAGIFWASDEGIVWLRGNQMVLLDKRIGFGDWFDDLNNTQREDICIGSCDKTNQVLIWHTPVDTGGSLSTRILTYDYEYNFASEFTGLTAGDGSADYAAHFRSNEGSHLIVWNNNAAARYPTESVDTDTSSIIDAWISENSNTPKTMGFLTMDLGALEGGDLTITVEAHDQEATGTAALPTASATRSITISQGINPASRRRFHEFIGMRGRMFRITLTGAAALDWSIKNLRAEYDMDEASDARSN